jgi:transposase
MKDVAKRCNVSPYTVGRILDTISHAAPKLGKAISIDEFNGNSEGQKYQCIVVDPIKHSVLDVLPDRNYNHLASYFRSLPRNERYRVEFFVCDMWRPYVDLARSFFPNAKIIIDKYHFVRQTSWAIENVRKRLQKTMIPSLRKYYKRSHREVFSSCLKICEMNEDIKLVANIDKERDSSESRPNS